MHFLIGVAIFMLLIWVALFPGFLVTYYLLPEFVRLNRYAVWLSAAGAILIMYAGIYYFAFVQTGSVAWSWYEDKKSFSIYSFLVLLVFVSFGTLGPTPSYNSRTPGNIWDWSTGEKPYTPRFALQIPHVKNTDLAEASARNIVDDPAPTAQEPEPARPRRITNVVDVNSINADNLKNNLEGIVGGSFAVHPDDLIIRLKQIGVIPGKPINTISGMIGYKPNANITIFGFPVMEIWSPDLVKKRSGDTAAYSLIFTISSEWSPEEVKPKLKGNGVILFGNQNYTAEVGDWNGRTAIHAGHDWHNYLTATYTYLPESSQVEPSAGTVDNRPIPTNAEQDKLALQGWSCKSGYIQKNLECIKAGDQVTSAPKGRIHYVLDVKGNKVIIYDSNKNKTDVINNGRFHVESAEFINDNLIRVRSVSSGGSEDIKFNPETGIIVRYDKENPRHSNLHGGGLKDNLILSVSGNKVHIINKNGDGDVLREILIKEADALSAEFIERNKIKIISESGRVWVYDWNGLNAVSPASKNKKQYQKDKIIIEGEGVSCDLRNICTNGLECRGNICQSVPSPDEVRFSDEVMFLGNKDASEWLSCDYRKECPRGFECQGNICLNFRK